MLCVCVRARVCVRACVCLRVYVCVCAIALSCAFNCFNNPAQVLHLKDGIWVLHYLKVIELL